MKISTLSERALSEYDQAVEEEKEKLIERAKAFVNLCFGDWVAKYEVEDDYFGRYVLITVKPRLGGLFYDLLLRYDLPGGTLRLGRVELFGFGHEWSTPINSLKSLGRQLQHFELGLERYSCGGPM